MATLRFGKVLKTLVFFFLFFISIVNAKADILTPSSLYTLTASSLSYCPGEGVTFSISNTIPPLGQECILYKNGVLQVSVISNGVSYIHFSGTYTSGVYTTNLETTPVTITENPLINYYADGDGDGYGAGAAIPACVQPANTVLNNTDCNDSNSSIYPGAPEIPADGIDQNCDNRESCYQDADGDHYGSHTVISSMDLDCTDTNESGVNYDCDDGNAAVNHSATEVCNGIDDDCDGAIDEGQPVSYADADSDGFGFGPPVTCGPANNNTDCDDSAILYADNDGDGYGAGAPAACGVTNNTDCNDSDATMHATFNFYPDIDGDGYGSGTLVSVCAVNESTPPVGYSVNNSDNCSGVSNPTQLNSDDDPLGDVCDNCPFVSNIAQQNSDGDPLGDACDNCPSVSNIAQQNSDSDPLGDACDNCPSVSNIAQQNSDGDPLGDACDNCPSVSNIAQQNSDGDPLGDACDNCPSVSNIAQQNSDSDPLGDACDNCPSVSNIAQQNSDGDPLGDACDNCPSVSNPDQKNTDGDAFGDACDPDDDNDGVPDAGDCAPTDNTKWQSAVLYIDSDNDGYDYGTATVCYGGTIPAGYKTTTSGSDCYDSNASVHPGAVEICDNGLDENCNGQIDECYLLTITNSGTGSGMVNSSPAGIDCGAYCSYLFSPGTEVTLTATPGSTSTFEGWAGGCSGTGTCYITMNSNKNATATFSCLPDTPGAVSGDNSVCTGTSHTYSVVAVPNTTSYTWILPAGATGTSTTNIITVYYGTSSISGEISVNGNNACGAGSKSTLSVVVNPPPVRPVITQSDLILNSSAISGNQWYDQNGLIVGANDQNYTVTSDGDYYVIVTDGNSCTSEPSEIVHVIVTGIENTGMDKIKVYPNPTTGLLKLVLPANFQNSVNFSLYNSTGSLVKRYSYKIVSNEIDFDFSDLKSGTYILNIQDVKINKSKKLTVIILP